MKAVFENRVTSITNEYNEDVDDYVPYSAFNNFIRIEDVENAAAAFAQEDGDGDDSGSWSLTVLFLLADDGNIIWDYRSDYAKEEKVRMVEADS